MNLFEKILQKYILSNEIIIEKSDLQIIYNIQNIRCIKCQSKQGKKNKKTYYNWFGTINNVQYALNLSRTNLYKKRIQVYCKFCHKNIGTVLLCNIFNFKFNDENTLSININFNKSCKKCAAKHNFIDNIEKSKQTCLKKYGVEWSFQSQNNKKKSIQTKIKKYGQNWKKIQGSWMHNYQKDGKIIRHNGDIPQIRAKMVQNWRKTVALKSIQEMTAWRSAIIGNNISKIAIQCLDTIQQQLNIIIQREVHIGSYFIDGYIENRLILEFYGNYWHANPNIYNANDILSFHNINKKVSDIWQHDKERLNKIIKEKQLPIIIIWEQSYFNYKNEIGKKIKKLLDNGELKNGQIYYI